MGLIINMVEQQTKMFVAYILISTIPNRVKLPLFRSMYEKIAQRYKTLGRVVPTRQVVPCRPLDASEYSC